MAVAFFCLFYVGGAFAIVTGSPSQFESNDGNMTLGGNPTPPGNGNTDWNCFAGPANLGGFSTSTDFSSHTGCAKTSGATQVSADLPSPPGEITWTKGQKFDTQCPTVDTKSTPPKDDFTNVAEFQEKDGSGNLFFYGGSIRSTANGNTSGDVEFNQATAPLGSFACRTAGDLLIAYDFLNGGTNLDFHVLTWIDSTHQGLGGNSGKCFVKTDSLPCWGANVITPDSSTFDGAANQSPIPANQNGFSHSALVAQQFAEFGINLTQALGGGALPCFPQQVWESRSSGSSFTSSPEDLEFVHLSTCGSVTIIKHTDPRGLDKTFSYTSNLDSSSGCSQTLTSGGFSLNDSGNSTTDNAANTNNCTTVAAGTTTVNETPVPDGFTFKSLTCVDSMGNSTQTSGTTATIRVVGNGSTTCTYVNQKNTAALSTQQSTTTTTVFPGTNVSDTATVTGNQTADTPSGNVTFYLCGPSQTALSGCSSSDSSRTLVGSSTGVALIGTGATASATSDNVNTTGSPLAVGNYCFEASWPGDTNYPGALDDTSATNECFTVAKANTQTVTTPSDISGTSQPSIILGGTEYDTAVVTGTTAGGTPTGNVVFHVCGPIATGNCSTGGTLVGTPPGTVALGAPTTATTATAISAGFTPTATGRYCFRGEYGGSLVYNSSSDPTNTTATNECFTVTQIGTTTTTTPSSNGLPLLGPTVNFGDQTIYDHAVVQANTTGDGTPTGTVTFTLCSPSQMAAAGNESTCATGGTQVGSAVTLGSALGDSPPDAAADSSAFTNGGSGVNQTGTWCWRADYTPTGSAYTGSSDSRSTECFTVVDTTSAASTQTWYPNDSASVSSTNGANLKGMLSIQLYTNADCGKTESGNGGVSNAAVNASTTLTGTSSTGTVSTSNTTYSVGTPGGSYSWLVTFSSTDPNVSGSKHCETTSLTINDNPSQ